MEDLTSVNAGQVSDGGSQNTTVSESVHEEAATSQKLVQTPEQNAEFARVRREAETKAKDELIATMGYEYNGKPIKTYSEYQQALKDSEEAEKRATFEQQNGFSPEAIKPLFEQWKESDPDFQELKSIRAEKKSTQALTDLNNELKDAGVDLQLKDLSDDELKKIPNVDKVTEIVKKGHSLADAFFLANKKEIINRQSQTAQQEAIKKIAANGASSPGSLSAGGGDDFISLESFEANKGNTEWVKNNFTKIMKSRSKWGG